MFNKLELRIHHLKLVRKSLITSPTEAAQSVVKTLARIRLAQQYPEPDLSDELYYLDILGRVKEPAIDFSSAEILYRQSLAQTLANIINLPDHTLVNLIAINKDPICKLAKIGKHCSEKPGHSAYEDIGGEFDTLYILQRMMGQSLIIDSQARLATTTMGPIRNVLTNMNDEDTRKYFDD